MPAGKKIDIKTATREELAEEFRDVGEQIRAAQKYHTALFTEIFDRYQQQGLTPVDIIANLTYENGKK